jgi:hypothetical protein
VKRLFLMYCLIELLLPLTVLAGIQANGTRVIYPAGKREVTLGLTNRDIAPRLIQAWVDKGDNEVNPQQGMSAFIVIPYFSPGWRKRASTAYYVYWSTTSSRSGVSFLAQCVGSAT